MEVNPQNFERLRQLYSQRESLQYYYDALTGNEQRQAKFRDRHGENIDAARLRESPGLWLLAEVDCRYPVEKETGGSYWNNRSIPLLHLLREGDVPEFSTIANLLFDSIIRSLRRRIDAIDAEIRSIP